MIEIALIRHGKTKGNIEHRYIGITDEQLSQSGIDEVRKKTYPKADAVFASPMKRCIQTAQLIYPDQKVMLHDGFKECNFGEFENKNYEMLKDLPAYREFLRNGFIEKFPKGEAVEEFKNRCISAFDEIVHKCMEDGVRKAACIVHGGTIMSVMECFAHPHKSYYDWQCSCGNGYIAEIERGKWPERISTQPLWGGECR